MSRLAQLPSQGYRRTTQRGAILDILEASGGHLTAAEIIDAIAERRLPVNRSTVYRTLETLLDAGLVRASRLGRSTSYELTHPEGEVEHHHLVCRECQAMLHVTGSGVTEILRAEAAQAGFRVEDVQLVATGLCRKCRRSRRRP
ncbi:MAG: Fur family transcriptional regulator, ferric uptake regulator [Chloroflexota bacterium]|jgi:Fur family ferric uptake transcriptional regulator|nr:Fur family transcriptional regulator, ferric uptake regulator [Chloroflexota bacterium]